MWLINPYESRISEAISDAKRALGAALDAPPTYIMCSVEEGQDGIEISWTLTTSWPSVEPATTGSKPTDEKP
jgi:hypothetical protein